MSTKFNPFDGSDGSESDSSELSNDLGYQKNWIKHVEDERAAKVNGKHVLLLSEKEEKPKQNRNKKHD